MNANFIASKVKYDKDLHYPLIEKINPIYGLKVLINQLESENWILFDVTLNDGMVGIIICRIEKEINDTFELVILHVCSALHQEIPFIVIIEPLINDIAKKSKCKTIRVHSGKLSINKLIEKQTKFKYFETVYIKDI